MKDGLARRAITRRWLEKCRQPVRHTLNRHEPRCAFKARHSAQERDARHRTGENRLAPGIHAFNGTAIFRLPADMRKADARHRLPRLHQRLDKLTMASPPRLEAARCHQRASASMRYDSHFDKVGRDTPPGGWPSL